MPQSWMHCSLLPHHNCCVETGVRWRKPSPPSLRLTSAERCACPPNLTLTLTLAGAHQGRGLGRMFLRHLRRTRIILHVLDAAAVDPITDYYAVREELRLYNPEYCSRPHVVALNKMDLEDAAGLREEVSARGFGKAQEAGALLTSGK